MTFTFFKSYHSKLLLEDQFGLTMVPEIGRRRWDRTVGRYHRGIGSGRVWRPSSQSRRRWWRRRWWRIGGCSMAETIATQQGFSEHWSCPFGGKSRWIAHLGSWNLPTNLRILPSHPKVAAQYNTTNLEITYILSLDNIWQAHMD